MLSWAMPIWFAYSILACSLTATSLLVRATPADNANEVWIEHIDDAIHYRGPISVAGQKRLLALHRDGNRNGIVKWLVVTSSGGEVNLAMDIGDWIFANKLNVRVIDRCLSSCANYIFTAATVKVIEPGAIVAWHGSAILSEAQSRTQIMDIIKRDILPRTPETERTAVASQLLRDTLDDLKRSRERQAQFFKKIQVDERITTIGQNHPAVRDFWFLSVAAMARFGIGFVVAPSDYPTTNTSRFGEGAVTYIDVDADFRSRGGLSGFEPTNNASSFRSSLPYHATRPRNEFRQDRLRLVQTD